MRAFEGDGADRRVSVDGGVGPVWDPSGRRLYYVDPDRRLMATDVARAPGFRFRSPTPLLDGFSGGNWTPNGLTSLRGFDVSPDGSRFVTTRPEQRPDRLHLVTNWFAELRALAPPSEGR